MYTTLKHKVFLLRASDEVKDAMYENLLPLTIVMYILVTEYLIRGDYRVLLKDPIMLFICLAIILVFTNIFINVYRAIKPQDEVEED